MGLSETLEYRWQARSSSSHFILLHPSGT